MRAGIVRQTFIICVVCTAFLFASIANRVSISAQTDQRRLGRDQTTASEKRIALVIGNGAYTKGRLKNPPNDARAMAKALREVGFEVQEVIDADKVRIQRAMRDFGKKLRETGGVGLFYYAGHGVQVAGHNFLIPVGAENEVEAEADVDIFCIDAENVLRQMEVAGSRINIVIMDACRDNPFSRSFRRGTPLGLAEINAPSGTLIAYSTDPGQTASDGDGENGLYTQELLAKMREPGLRIEDVFNLAGAEVERKSGRKQQPWISSKLRGAFYFREPVASNTQPVKLADPGAVEQESWEVIRNSNDPEDFKEFLKTFPNGVNSPTAKLKLRKLEAATHPSPSKPTGSDTSSRPPVTSKTGTLSPGMQVEGAVGIKLVFIPAGEFQMGSENGDSEQKPVHRVQITEPFWMGKYEVTQAQWEAVMGRNPSNFRGCSQCPIDQVSWNDCQDFIRKLNAKGDGNTYRLPTEAEWEYACRAGTTGDFAGSLETMGWYGENSGNKPHPVGKKQANAWGLYDMHGNVCEWCQDWFEKYPSNIVTNPTGPSTGSGRIRRGGGWGNTAEYCRSATRLSDSPGARGSNLGFRLVMLQK